MFNIETKVIINKFYEINQLQYGILHNVISNNELLNFSMIKYFKNIKIIKPCL